MPGFDPTQPFQVVGRDGPRYFPALDPVPPLTAAQIRDIKVEQGKATPQEILDYEHDQLTAEKGFLRAGLGIGEEGKGILRQALGSTITLGGKVLGNINPTARLLRRRGRNIGDQYIEEAGRAVSELGTENIREAREIGQELGGGETGEMIQDLGATFTASAPAILAAILGGLPAAALTAGATQYGASREQYKQQFMAQGLPELEAERRAEIPAALGGIITATLTRAIPGGSEMLLNRILSGEITKSGAAKFVANLVARELPSEMGEESLDQIGQGFVERLMVNPNKSFHEIAEETVNAATAAGLLTTFMGGGGAVVARAGQAISEPIQNRLEESDFRRQSRRLADMQARAGFRPSGINTATERTYATTQREESNQQQYQPPPKQGLPTTPSGSDIVQPSTPPEAQAPIDTSNFIVSVQAPSGEVPGNIQIIDRTQTETSQSPTVESLRAAGLPVPDFSTLPQGQYPYAQAIQILQGGQRSPQQVPVREGAGTIPAAPPAIQIIGTVPVGQEDLFGLVKKYVDEQNKFHPGLPIRRIQISDNPELRVFTEIYKGGFDTIGVNFDFLGSLGPNVDRESFIKYSINEEAIHNAVGYAAHDKWKSNTPGRINQLSSIGVKDFWDFFTLEMNEIYNQMTPDQVRSVKAAYGSTDLEPHQVAEEFVRGIIQNRLLGKPTELATYKLAPKVVEYLKLILDKLVAFFNAAQDSDQKLRIKEYIDAAESILTEQQARPPAERFESEGQVAGAAEPGSRLLQIQKEADEAYQRYKATPQYQAYEVADVEPGMPGFYNRPREEIEAAYKSISDLRNIALDTPEAKDWYSKYKAVSDIGEQEQFDAQVERLKNRSWDAPKRDVVPENEDIGRLSVRASEFKVPVHGGFLDDAESILSNGLTRGSAIDLTPEKEWVSGYEVAYVVPTARKGKKIEHNQFYNSANRAPVAKVIVDNGAYTESQRDVVAALASRFPGVTFELIGEDGRLEYFNVPESPFDRMRRESGSEPAPELTPEEQAAKDRNERRRGMRPNPRVAGAFSPQDKLAAENGDEFWVETKVGGTEDLVRDRVRMTPESTAESQRHAERVFKEAGIEVTWLEHTPATEEQPSKGIWRYVQKKNHEGGRKLVALLNRELAKNNAPLVGSLLNSVRYNNKLGNDQAVFDAPTRMALYIAAQAEASHRGLALGELSQHPATLPDIARNVDVVLNRIYHDAFGGEVIDEAMDKLRRGIQTFFSKPFIQQILAANPQLNESIEMINALGLGNQVPDAAQLIYEVFQTPFYKISDLAEMFRNKLVKDYGMDEGEAKKAGRRFQEAFDKHLKQAADEALKIATANLTYKKKVAVKSRKTVEQLLKDAIKKGQLDSGDVLREIAKENWGSTPSDADIAEMKRLANKHDELAALTPVEEAEVRKLEGDTPEAVERARKIKEDANQPVRTAIQKQTEVAWARMKKPININPFTRPFWQTKANLAAAINEFIAANILSKVSFATRQLVAIFSQWISYVPTRAIADALVNYQHARVNGQQSRMPQEIASALRDGYKQQFGALLPALSAMRSALFGRAESRNVGQLMSDMATLERLTKNAEEHWNKANELMAAGNVAGASAEFSKASLFYFISMTKMGYRVAQGLDRLQGIPVHYQNMSQQVMRALRDAGKTVAEAETSRDFVIGDIKQQWLLAIPIAKMYLERSGEKFSTQDIKNAAWNVVKRQQYHRIATLPIESDQFESQNEFLENTVGWNQREVRGLGGAVAGAMRKVEQVAESWGIPLVVTRFANAIGISINRSLAYTPLFKQANFGSGNESAWFKTETDRMQRRVEAAVGSALGSVAIGLVMSGYLVVRLKWPRDKEERDLWEREGHRPNTVEWKISDTEFIPFSLNNSPFMFVAPYLAAGGALRDAFDEQTKAQAKLDEEALKAGLPAGKAPGPGPADLFLVAAEAAKQVVLGGRTAAGLIGSVSSYGTPNAKKTAGSYVSALVPFAPAAQDISRMAGVRMDEKMASVWDFILPLPGSEARKVNMLGDPVSTPDDIQRVLQIMTGGTYPGVVDSGAARQESGYSALFASGFRPPSISPGKGYDIRGVFRPMDESELAKYTRTRGEYFKQALSGFGAAATMEEVRAAYQDANQRALRDIGSAIPTTSQTQLRTTTTTRPTSSRRPRRSRYGSGLRRGRSPRLRSGRKIRALRRPGLVKPQRRTRLLAA